VCHTGIGDDEPKVGGRFDKLRLNADMILRFATALEICNNPIEVLFARYFSSRVLR
jgi:hypothetical protein